MKTADFRRKAREARQARQQVSSTPKTPGQLSGKKRDVPKGQREDAPKNKACISLIDEMSAAALLGKQFHVAFMLPRVPLSHILIYVYILHGIQQVSKGRSRSGSSDEEQHSVSCYSASSDVEDITPRRQVPVVKKRIINAKVC